MGGSTQAELWNGRSGEAWVRRQEILDPVLREMGRLALDAAGLTAGARVLDVGCGCGDTAIEVAERVGERGRVFGVDISAPMLARAKERAAARGVAGRVDFAVADAATHPFEPGSFDAIVSRFGIMFFDDPPRAFANLRRALRPSGRLAFICWRAPDENPWATVPLAAVASVAPIPKKGSPHDPGPFAFADGARVRAILDEAGFADVAVTPHDPPMALGPHGPGTKVEDVLQYLSEIGPAASAMAELDEPTRAKARAAVEAAVRELPPRAPDDESRWLPSAVWLVTARA